MLYRERGGDESPLHFEVMAGSKAGPYNEGKSMKKFLGVLALSAMLAVPLTVVAAGADNTTGGLPPAVDQLLARDMVQQAQLYLKTAGFNPGRVDGIFDAQTSGAVRQYQAANGIPASGLLDEPTRSVMFPGFDSAGED